MLLQKQGEMLLAFRVSMNQVTPSKEDAMIALVSLVEAKIQQVLIESVRQLPVTQSMIATNKVSVLQSVQWYLRTSWPSG